MIYQGPPISRGDYSLVAPDEDCLSRWVEILRASPWSLEDSLRANGVESWARGCMESPNSLVFAALDGLDWAGVVYLSHVRTGQDAIVSGYGLRMGGPRRTLERASAVLSLACAWAFVINEVEVVRIDFAAANKSIRAVAKLAGFSFAGFHSAHRTHGGVHVPTVVYEMTKEQWHGQRAGLTLDSSGVATAGLRQL